MSRDPDLAFERRGGPCDHYRCQDEPDGCRMYTDRALTPDDDERTEGARLVAEGWVQTSRKHRQLSRLRVPFPGMDIIAPEWREHPYAKHLIGQPHTQRHWMLGAFAHNPELVEHLTVTPAVFAAFRAAGGDIR